MLSFDFILIIKPNNISKVRPIDDIIKIGVNFSPINRPMAPKSSNIMVNSPSFSILNRLNSFFIWGDKKYEAT